MTTTTSARSAGLLLAASGILAAAGGATLAIVFGWPAVLDEPGTVVLPRFSADEAMIRAGFYVLLISSLVLIPAAYLLEAALTRPTGGTRALTIFGVAGAMFQILGWVRWPIAVPYLADSYAAADSETARQSIATSFDLLNRYAGGALGEHLGWLFQGIWAVFVGLIVLRAVGLPRWFGQLGLVLAVAWAVLVPGSAILRSDAMTAIGQPFYSAWYLWLLALGVLLVVRTVGPGQSRSASE